MKISSRGRYGLKAMADLALNYGAEKTPLKDVAARQNIPLKYLEQIFAALNKGGLVKSVKGAQGGYFLAFAPSQITVEQIVNILEGDYLAVESEVEDTGDVEYIINKLVYAELKSIVYNHLCSVTLEKIVNDYKTVTENIYFTI